MVMGKDFQDKIDNFMFDRMSTDEKIQFEAEINQDKSKKEQFEFTQNVKKAISSRQEKMDRLKEMKMTYEEYQKPSSIRLTGTDGMPCCEEIQYWTQLKKKKQSRHVWLWTSGIAAMLIVVLVVFNPFGFESTFDSKMELIPNEGQRGDYEPFIEKVECFDSIKELLIDSTYIDTIDYEVVE